MCFDNTYENKKLKKISKIAMDPKVIDGFENSQVKTLHLFNLFPFVGAQR